MTREQSTDWTAKPTGKPGEDQLGLEPLDGRGMLAKMIGAKMTELTGFSPSSSLCHDVAERVLAEARASGETLHLRVRW